MKVDIKKKWVSALRSGKYKKTTGALKKNGRYCCLGLLTELYIKEQGATNPNAKWEGPSHERRFKGESMTLPYAVQKWAGFRTPDPTVRVVGEGRVKLSELNDGRGGKPGETFRVIADRIEANL